MQKQGIGLKIGLRKTLIERWRIKMARMNAKTRNIKLLSIH